MAITVTAITVAARMVAVMTVVVITVTVITAAYLRLCSAPAIKVSYAYVLSVSVWRLGFGVVEARNPKPETVNPHYSALAETVLCPICLQL